MKLRKWISPFFIISTSLLTYSATNAQEHKINLRNFEPRPRTIKIKTYGECSMCQKRILNALKVEGIRSAKWDPETKVLTVKYILSDIITSERKINQLVAAAGHDTYFATAPDDAYESLPEECKYERPAHLREARH